MVHTAFFTKSSSTILLVDDEADIVLTLQDLLEGEEHYLPALTK